MKKIIAFFHNLCVRDSLEMEDNNVFPKTNLRMSMPPVKEKDND